MTDVELTSSGEHKRIVMYGELAVCDTCVNSLGFNIRWDQSHPEAVSS